MTEPGDWVGYYDGQGEREPHDLLLRVLDRFEQNGRRGRAVDVGCGQGFETGEQLRRGWEVVAIDAQEEAIRRERIRGSLRPGGRFAGELFGDRDTWASTETDMTFFETDRARALFDGMELESFVEEESEDEGWDGMKHWHVFHVIARR